MQGALSGGLVAMVLNLWMMIGQTLYKTQTQTLRTATQGIKAP